MTELQCNYRLHMVVTQDSVQSAHEVLAVYGRLWTTDTTTNRYTVQWSDT